MTIDGYVYDADTGDGIPSASISVADATGKATGNGVVADTTGHFSYSGSDLDTAGYLLFSSVGYKTLLAPYAIIFEQGGVQLEKKPAELPDVIVTPKPKSKSGALLAAGTLLVLATAIDRQKGRRGIGQAEGGGGKTDWTKIIIPIGVVGLGYFLLRTFTNTLGLTETADQRAQRQAQQDALQKSRDQVYATSPPTKSDAEWLAVADTIYNDLRSSSPLFNNNDTDDAAYQISTPKNQGDVFKLVQLFGSRMQSLFGITGPSMTLPEFIRKELDQDQIDTVNNNYQTKGISWQW